MIALTQTLENMFQTFSTDCLPAVVSRRERGQVMKIDNWSAY
jgi:hypothetical protein